MISQKELAKLFKPIKQYKTDRLIEILTELADYVAKAEQERADAVQKVKEFNEANKIKELREQLEAQKARRDNSWKFTIDPEDVEQIKKWKEKHELEKHNGSDYAGAIGGRYTYEFTPTSIGTFGRVRCSCGDYFDYDDGTDW